MIDSLLGLTGLCGSGLSIVGIGSEERQVLDFVTAFAIRSLNRVRVGRKRKKLSVELLID